MELDFEQIRELMAELERTGLTRMRLKTEFVELELERQVPEFEVPPLPSANVTEAVRSEPVALQSQPAAVQHNVAYVSSPMVGTFYRSPSPEDNPFVKEGDHVLAETVVCIIEAMKVMNEVKAGISGKIGRVLVENGQPVEFGSRLFEIIPE